MLEELPSPLLHEPCSVSLAASGSGLAPKWPQTNFRHFLRVRSSAFSEDVYTLLLILVAAMSKSISVQLITAVATACFGL